MQEKESLRVVYYGREVCDSEKQGRCSVPYANMIHFIESGHGYFNGKLLGPGQGFVCRRNRYATYQPLLENPWTYSWINVVGGQAEQIIKMLPMTADVFVWYPEKQIDILHEIVPYMNGIQDTAAEMRCLGIFYRLMSDLIVDAVAEKPDYVKQAQLYLERNYENGITISHMAEELNISRAYLRNIFYAQIGMSPQEYLMKLRMKRAEFLLSKGYRVTEVALAAGYKDVLQFSRMFKKCNKVSPTEYRKRFGH